MKKFIAILMCMLLLTMCFVSCDKTEVPENTDTDEISDTVIDNGTETDDDGNDTSDTNPVGGEKDDGIGEAGDNNADVNWTKPY